jgi:endonuclease YncB( thermonuclease family)
MKHHFMRGIGSLATSISPSRWLLLLSLLALVSVCLQRTLPLGNLNRSTSPHGYPAMASAHAWEQLEDCRLVSRSTNDGDSFRIAAAGKEHVFRLYFADCPETQRLHYSPSRIKDQGRYFAGLPESEVLALGKDAREFTANLLRSAPFTVFTRWERVFDSHRFYAHVRFPAAQGQPADLAETLVSAGLARIHTSGADHPLGPSERQQHQHLRSLERKAMAAGLGAWHHLSTR